MLSTAHRESVSRPIDEHHNERNRFRVVVLVGHRAGRCRVDAQIDVSAIALRIVHGWGCGGVSGHAWRPVAQRLRGRV